MCLVVHWRSHSINSNKELDFYDDKPATSSRKQPAPISGFSGHLSHPPTLLCALPASLRATLAMLHRLLSTLPGARLPAICARPTDHLGEPPPTCQNTRRHPPALRAARAP